MGWIRSADSLPKKEGFYVVVVPYGQGIDLARFGTIPNKKVVGFYQYNSHTGYAEVKPEYWAEVPGVPENGAVPGNRTQLR